VVAVSLLRLAAYVFGWNLALDRVLFHDRLATLSANLPNRMAPNTALAFLTLYTSPQILSSILAQKSASF
jgi:hypothetical protein